VSFELKENENWIAFKGSRGDLKYYRKYYNKFRINSWDFDFLILTFEFKNARRKEII
jgi:hypothetical protein